MTSQIHGGRFGKDKERHQKHQSWENSLCLRASVHCYLLEKKLVWGEKNHFKVSRWHSLPEVKGRTKAELDSFPRVIFKVTPAHQINITSWQRGKSSGDRDACFLLCWQQGTAGGRDSGSSIVTPGRLVPPAACPPGQAGVPVQQHLPGTVRASSAQAPGRQQGMGSSTSRGREERTQPAWQKQTQTPPSGGYPQWVVPSRGVTTATKFHVHQDWALHWSASKDWTSSKVCLGQL